MNLDDEHFTELENYGSVANLFAELSYRYDEDEVEISEWRWEELSKKDIPKGSYSFLHFQKKLPFAVLRPITTLSRTQLQERKTLRA